MIFIAKLKQEEVKRFCSIFYELKVASLASVEISEIKEEKDKFQVMVCPKAPENEQPLLNALKNGILNELGFGEKFLET